MTQLDIFTHYKTGSLILTMVHDMNVELFITICGFLVQVSKVVMASFLQSHDQRSGQLGYKSHPYLSGRQHAYITLNCFKSQFMESWGGKIRIFLDIRIPHFAFLRHAPLNICSLPARYFCSVNLYVKTRVIAY